MHQLRWQHPLGQWPSVPSFILSIFKFYLGLTNCSLITSFDLIMNVELGFLQARSVVVYLWKGFCRKAWVRRWWNGKLVFKFQHLAYTTISKKWKPLKMFSRFFFNLQPKVIDWADAVNEVGASEWVKEIIFNLQSSIALLAMRSLVQVYSEGDNSKKRRHNAAFFILYHLARLWRAQLHAACHTKRSSYCGENWHYQLNHQFPSFFFHKVTNLSPCPPPRGREPAQRAVMQTTLKQANKAAKRFYSRGLLRGIDFKE